MNIELAKIAIDKMAFFIPEDILNNLYKDHDATAEVLAQDENRVVFSIVYHDKKDKRILSITVKRNEINVHYNGTMQVFSHRIDESFYNDVLSVLFDVQAVQPVKINQVEKNTMTTLANSENRTLFILKVKETNNKTTYYKKFLVGVYFDKWFTISHAAFMSSMNVNHRITYEETLYSDADISETIYHVTYFKPKSDIV